MQRLVDGPEQSWLSARQVAAYLGIGQTLFKELLASGEFPAGVAFGRQAIRWSWLTVVAWAHLRPRRQGTEESRPAPRRGG